MQLKDIADFTYNQCAYTSDLAHNDPVRKEQRARLMVAKAVSEGYIDPPTTCEECGKQRDYPYTSEFHAHHEDYDKPLEIIWLCQPCHRAKHPVRRQYTPAARREQEAAR